MSDDHSLFLLLHLRPGAMRARLDRLEQAGMPRPNLWQLWLGVLYMYHRMLFRSDTIGVDPEARIRSGWRARLWRWRPARAPVLAWKRAVNPLDHTGLASSDAHIIRHLVGAYHRGDNFHYDLALLGASPGGLEALHARVLAIVEGRARDAELLRDLNVYEGYHERLLAAVEAWERGEVELSHVNPDTTLPAFLAWCAAQPADPRATLEALWRGELSFAPAVPA